MEKFDEIKIFVSKDTEEMEMICTLEKGYRWDVVVQVGNEFFEPEYYTFWQLSNGFRDSIKNNQVYYISPCLILVDNVTKENIIKATLDLQKNTNFFSRFIPSQNINPQELVQIFPVKDLK